MLRLLHMIRDLFILFSFRLIFPTKTWLREKTQNIPVTKTAISKGLEMRVGMMQEGEKCGAGDD